MNYKLSDIESVKAYSNEFGRDEFDYFCDLKSNKIEELLDILSKSWGDKGQISTYEYRFVLNFKNGTSETLDFKKNEILKNGKRLHFVKTSHPVTHFFSEFNFNNNAVVRLIQFKNSKPTLDWIDRMWEGDTGFTPDSIRQIEPVLDNYILELIRLKPNTEEDLMKIVKKCYDGLNIVSDSYPGMIETLEREELVDFVEFGAKFTGIDTIDFDEKTNQWRAW